MSSWKTRFWDYTRFTECQHPDITAAGLDKAEKNFNTCELSPLRDCFLFWKKNEACDGNGFDWEFDREYFKRQIRKAKRGECLAKRRVALMTRIILTHGVTL